MRPVDPLFADRVEAFHRALHALNETRDLGYAAMQEVLRVEIGGECAAALFAARFALQYEYKVKYWMAAVEVLERLQGASALASAVFTAYNKHAPASLPDARARLKKAVDEYSASASSVAAMFEALKDLVTTIMRCVK